MGKVVKTEILYEGFFFELDEDELMYSPWTNSKLEHRIDTPHITVYYKPSELHDYYYGKRGLFELYKYGCDDKNEGYKVRYIKSDCIDVPWLFNLVDIPHVTISVSDDGKPKDTKNLDFKPCETYRYEAVFGAMQLWTYDDGTKIMVKALG